MTRPDHRTPARSVDTVVEIGAPVETVWAALTTPEGLRNFYCDWAEVEPGVGGTFQIGWGVGGLPPATIEVWDPPTRLRFVYAAPAGDDDVTTAEEWVLRPEGDRTVVRLVYEGFGEGTDWDDFYDRFDATARLVVDLLANWLDRHGGRPLTKLWVDVPVAADQRTAWAALGPDLHDDAVAPVALPAGAPVRLPLPAGEPLTGTVVHVAPGSEVAVELDDPALDAARFVGVVRAGPTPATARLLLEIYTYGLPAAVTEPVQDRLDRIGDALSHRPAGSSAADRSHAVTGPHRQPTTQEDPVPTYAPPGSHAVTPYLCCRDAARAIEFYVEVFGGTETGTRFVDGDGRVGHAEITLGDSLVYLADEFPDIGVVAPDPAASSVSIMLYVADVDAVVARARAAGAEVLKPVEDTFYGSRRATLVDPSGHRWLVGTHVRDASPEVVAAAADDFARSS